MSIEIRPVGVAINVLDHGIVSLEDHMGSDAFIARAARTSYGKGLEIKTADDDRRLIRRLVRDKHTSPLEMGVVVFYLKLPIFVMRQLVRHRMASLNEFSARYKELPDVFHIPDTFRKQATKNKQGSDGVFTPEHNEELKTAVEGFYAVSMEMYHYLLDEGVAKEQAREVIPVDIYTECYWKQDIHNFFHLCKLRLDPHAQLEIRVYAQAMYDLAKPYFPETAQAFEDYILNARSVSALDVKLMRDLVLGGASTDPKVYGMSQNEFDDFHAWWVKSMVR